MHYVDPPVEATPPALPDPFAENEEQSLEGQADPVEEEKPQKSDNAALDSVEPRSEPQQAVPEHMQEKQTEADSGGKVEPAEYAAVSEPETQTAPPSLDEGADPEVAEDPPASAPANSAVSFLQWSPEAARRKAFVKIEGGPFTLVHEGDSVGGYTVVEIQQDAVALRSGTARFRLRVR